MSSTTDIADKKLEAPALRLLATGGLIGWSGSALHHHRPDRSGLQRDDEGGDGARKRELLRRKSGEPIGEAI